MAICFRSRYWEQDDENTHLLDELKRVNVAKYPQYSEYLLGSSENFPQTCQKYDYVLINDNKLSSSTQNSPSYVMAEPLFPFPSPNQDNGTPIEVQYFIKHHNLALVMITLL